MIEIVMLSLLALAITACFFPFQYFNAAKLAKKLEIPQDSVLRRHFLTHLRHEDALVSMALEKRLAKIR